MEKKVFEIWLDNCNRPWLAYRTDDEVSANEFLSSAQGKYQYISLYVYNGQGVILSIQTFRRQ